RRRCRSAGETAGSPPPRGGRPPPRSFPCCPTRGAPPAGRVTPEIRACASFPCPRRRSLRLARFRADCRELITAREAPAGQADQGNSVADPGLLPMAAGLL